MRLLVGWIVMVSLSAISRWVVAPWMLAEGERRIAEAERGTIDFGGILMSASADTFFGILIPVAMLGMMGIVTVQELARKLTRRR